MKKWHADGERILPRIIFNKKLDEMKNILNEVKASLEDEFGRLEPCICGTLDVPSEFGDNWKALLYLKRSSHLCIFRMVCKMNWMPLFGYLCTWCFLSNKISLCLLECLRLLNFWGSSVCNGSSNFSLMFGKAFTFLARAQKYELFKPDVPWPLL